VFENGYPPGAVAELVGMSGNSGLQADFVTAGLWRARLEMVNNPHSNNPETIESYVGSLGNATVGSREAAQAVIRFAEDNGMGFDEEALQNPGVESLRWILQQFHDADQLMADGDSRRSFINFLEAAVLGSGPELSTRESAELFFAITGASTDDTGLLEADGVGGQSNPRATELTAQLFQQNYDGWIASPELRLHGYGQIYENGPPDTPLEGVDLNGSFRTFFDEALLRPEEAGDYRADLFSFVIGKAFEAMSPDSAFVQAAGGVEAAATLAGNLIGQISGAEVDAIRGYAADAASEERMRERAWTMLTVVSIAGSGAGFAAREGVTMTAKIVIAALVETGKSGGRIVADELIDQDVDPYTAEMIADYVNNGDIAANAFEKSEMFKDLAEAGVGEDRLRAFNDWLITSIGDEDFTLGKAIRDSLPVLTNDLPDDLGQVLDVYAANFGAAFDRQERAN
jgi:hypothetical protein